MRSFAQVVFDGKTTPGLSAGLFSKVKRSIFNSLYNLVLRFCDPLVRCNIAGFSLALPFSHNRLATAVNSHSQYSSNVGRIARCVLQKYSDLRLIDIGAYIGDSIAFLRKEAEFPILCIEGDELIFPILKRNAALFPDVDTLKAYIGEENKSIEATVVQKIGSGHLKRKKSLQAQNTVQINKFSAVLKDKPDFVHAKMIKIDTDGFDCKVLQGALDFLTCAKPIVFFEYDPFFLSKQGDDGISVFSRLYEIGYRNLLIYDNFGNFMLSTAVNNSSLLKEIHLYFSGWKGKRYCDICVFHQEDTGLFEEAKNKETNFFKQLRANT